MSSNSALKVVSSSTFGLLSRQLVLPAMCLLNCFLILMCISTGDVNVQTSQVFESVFINSGDNPFKLINNSVKYVSPLYQ